MLMMIGSGPLQRGSGSLTAPVMQGVLVLGRGLLGAGGWECEDGLSSQVLDQRLTGHARCSRFIGGEHCGQPAVDVPGNATAQAEEEAQAEDAAARELTALNNRMELRRDEDHLHLW